MSKTICSVDCAEFGKSCAETDGQPFENQCFIAKYIHIGGTQKYLEFKQKLIGEFNSLQIQGMPIVDDLHAFAGSLINLEYTLPSRQTIKLLDDNSIYLSNQFECEFDENQCYGVIAGMDFLMVCTYGKNGTNPELIIYKRR